jgi:hypothetical protein
MRKLILTTAISMFVCTGCPDNAPPPPVPAFEPCGSSTITITGQMGQKTFVGVQGKLDENSESVVWSAPSDTNTAIDGASVSDQTTFNKDTGERRFAVLGEAGGFTLMVTGVINADCTGSGEWIVTNSSGVKKGKGQWTMP